MVETLLNLVFPRVCVCCGAECSLDRQHLCWECRRQVLLIRPPYCSLCGDPVAGSIDHAYVCAMCTTMTRYFDLARSAAHFEGPIREAIHAFKYGGACWLASELGALIEAVFAVNVDPHQVDGICAVPLHASRRRERGYNQAALLAAHLAQRIQRPLLRRLLIRTKKTATQTNLTAAQRLINIKNSFRSVSSWIEGRRILLIDDVMTTGVTVNECARALKQGGAIRVTVLTVARG